VWKKVGAGISSPVGEVGGGGQLCTYGFDDNKGNMSNFVVLGCGNTGHFTNLGLESPAIV